MKTYIVSVDLSIEAESAEGALEEARLTLGLAIGALNDQKEGAAALTLEEAEYAEPYVLNDHDTACIYEHDHEKGRCEYHD